MVNRGKLVLKLKRAKVGHTITRIIKNLLEETTMTIQGTTIQTHTGVPQGGVPSPLLFNLYIDELIRNLNEIPGTEAMGYADDIVAINPGYISCKGTIQLYKD